MLFEQFEFCRFLYVLHCETCCCNFLNNIMRTIESFKLMPSLHVDCGSHFSVKTISLSPIVFRCQTLKTIVVIGGVLRGHSFMTSTKNHVFDPPPLCPHGPDPPPPCGRPHPAPMKKKPPSLKNGRE